MSCNGNGECLIQCSCDCADCPKCNLPETECICECNGGDCCRVNNCVDTDGACNCMPSTIPRPVCTCGHRAHGESPPPRATFPYCKPDNPCSYNCEPVLCPNDAEHDTDKGVTFPQWYFNCHGGYCRNCNTLPWRRLFKHSDEIAECPVCYEDKPMSILICKHKLCWDCWVKICERAAEEYETEGSCPMCRKKQW
jgi:hypothetical protein